MALRHSDLAARDRAGPGARGAQGRSRELRGARARLCASVCCAAAAAGGFLAAAPAGVVSPAFRAYVERAHPCLARIIGPESGWDVTVDFGGGHGNTAESYGLGQANPGWKMAAFGRDWRSNPWTQLRWMVAYARRYGGECGAWAFWQAHRWW